ncbi:lysine-rich coiled-coil protein 1 [Bombina bombina]|uniref:lysine-rich coiled-coil protein 1 n=1 Tax=Bombina bombina TaxID=8345 RepID=UPI00235A7DCA|nr:lysine-rich coiled-coil protein 1 [Bombina bombina]
MRGSLLQPLAQFVDFDLQPLVKTMKSYVQDSNDFITRITKLDNIDRSDLLGKKHAQRVRLYFQRNEQEELSNKKQKLDHINFQVDGGGAFDKNKFCSLCNMVFSSPVVAQSHYVGKIHAKKLRQLPGENIQGLSQTDEMPSPVVSQPPNTAVPPVTMTSHSQTFVLSQEDLNSEQPSFPDNEADLSDPDKYCKLCCASFNNPLVAQQHYNGKKHARNEARRKMMEELEETGVPMEANGCDGKYVCPICSVSLTSIEMYQSHMQGNKHLTKENMVANLMKTSKKNYDSFQDELADYIKVQKARGLEPKTQFRQEKDQTDSCEYEEEEEFNSRSPREHTKQGAPYKNFDPHSTNYPAYNTKHPAVNRVPAWPSQWEKVYRSHNPDKGQFINMQKVHHRAHTPSSLDSSDDHKGSSSDESSDSHRKDRKHKRKHRKESRHRGVEKFKREDESVERKKRKIEADKLESEKAKKETEPSDKSKHRRDKKKKEEQTVKDSKKHKKVKKEGDQRTEEEILWDESILGF